VRRSTVISPVQHSLAGGSRASLRRPWASHRSGSEREPEHFGSGATLLGPCVLDGPTCTQAESSPITLFSRCCNSRLRSINAGRVRRNPRCSKRRRPMTQTRQPNGRADFDLEIGRWQAQRRHLKHVLQWPTNWEEFTGISVARKILLVYGYSTRSALSAPRGRSRESRCASSILRPSSRAHIPPTACRGRWPRP
jgi:hypothetical protein